MVDDAYKATNDLAFLKSAFVTLKKEYEFWMMKRVSDNGLNRHGSEEYEESCAAFYNGIVVDRIGKDSSREPKAVGTLTRVLTAIAPTLTP